MWKIPKIKDSLLDPPKRAIWAARGLMPELEHTAQPALLQVALHPPLSLLLYVISSFFPSFSEHGAVMRAQGAARVVQREGGGCQQWGATGMEPHILYLLSPVSAGHSSLAAGRSYSEPGSMGKHGGLGDSPNGGGILGGGLQAGNSRWDFSGDSSSPHTHTAVL